MPCCCRLRCLELPDPATLVWGEAALAKTFEQARDLFNAGMTHYKKALEYYELDGWVTEHCNTQMEISNLYRHATGKRNRLRMPAWCASC